MHVRLVDTVARDSFHEMFNAALLSMCLTAFERVEYVCHPSQQACIRRVLERHAPATDLKRVRFRPTAVVRREGPVGWVCRYALGALVNLWQLLTLPRGEQLIYTTNNPLGLWALNLLCRLRPRRVVVVCHGELELLAQCHPWWRASGWFGALLRRTFARTTLAPGLKCCVLGRSILRNLTPYVAPKNRAAFFSIDHPYFFSEAPAAPAPHAQLRVGTVGQLTPAKGLHRIVELAREIPVPLVVVGRTYGFDGHAACRNVRFVAGADNGFIPRERYDSEAAALDYLVFAYDPDGYRLTASGALFDALNLCRPVITLRNDYFDDVLRLRAGYVVDTVNDMAALVRRLAAAWPENPDYSLFCENLLRLRAEFAVETVASRFREALRTLYPESKKAER
ncbi:hypothetical protein [Alistipes sp.]|uniref:hypothetical protein n=1 Tax=Alistipes sp. TaxID=1872444 RepID=UPI003AF1D283